MTRKTLQFGSISEGTTKAEDIASALIGELDCLKLSAIDRGHLHSLRKDIEAVQDGEADDADTALDVLISIAENYTPAYAYVGMHPGDGADFGVWLSESFEDDFDGIKVSDLSELPKGYTGEALQVSDHGNITLYRVTRGRAREIWSLV